MTLLEEGRVKYGIGTTHQMCILMDRGGTVFKNGQKKLDKLDMGVIPALVDVLRHLYGTIQVRSPLYL